MQTHLRVIQDPKFNACQIEFESQNTYAKVGNLSEYFP